jgi:hypothetical protein
MQTQFDEDGLPLATNHAGWNVEKLTEKGWVPTFAEPMESKSDAQDCMKLAKYLNPGQEYRVYEALTR